MFTRIVNILFPVECPICKKHVEFSNPMGICNTCVGEIEVLNSPGCRYCGKPVSYGRVSCGSCRMRISNIDAIYTACIYKDSVKNLIINFKYFGKRFLSKYLGSLIIRLFNDKLISEEIDLILPVPLSKRRRSERGYNQAEMLANLLSKSSKIKLGNNYLIRTRETSPQYNLGRSERYDNVRDSFMVKRDVRGKRILLIDDVATTGSTLQSCAKPLKEAGSSNIFALVVAHGN